MQDIFSIRSLATWMQASKAQNVKVNPGTGSSPELRRTSSFDKTWEETVAESVADELVMQSFSSNKNGPFGSSEQTDEASKNKSKDPKGVKAGQSSLEEKKVAKSNEDKRSRPKKITEFHNIKISQVVSFVLFFHLLLMTKSCQFSGKLSIISCRWNYVLHMKGKDLL